MAQAMLLEKKRYLLEGLDCANCAMKIERKISGLPYTSDVSVNFATATMKLALEPAAPKDAFAQISKTIHQMEPEVTVVDITGKSLPVSNQPPTHSDGCCDHDHEHRHSHTEGQKDEKKNSFDSSNTSVPETKAKKNPFLSGEFLQIAVAAILFVIAYASPFPSWVKMAFMAVTVLLCGRKTLLAGIKNLLHLEAEENLLMSVAVVAAFIIGEYPEGAMVMLLFSFGEFLEELAVDRSRENIQSLTNIRPDTANLLSKDGASQPVPAETVPIGSKIVLRAGDRIPLDAVIVTGNSEIDSSALTGESVPLSVGPGDAVLSGSINESGLLICETTSSFQDSAASRIVRLVEDSVEKKGNTEKLITRFARIYTPIVMALAILLAIVPPLFGLGEFLYWINNALVFLVASCPCAFVIAVPLGFYSSIGGISKAGVLVKGGKYVETLATTTAALFDKTGTITSGELAVDRVVSLSKAFTEAEILKTAALAESFSGHPIARSVVRSYGETVDQSLVEEYEEIAGHGIHAIIGGKQVDCGNGRLMEQKGFPIKTLPPSNIYLAIDGTLAGQIFISDQIKPGANQAIKMLKEQGIKRIVMLTGDHEAAAKKVADACHIEEYHAGLLPEDKAKILEEIKSTNDSTLFAGDGINDAPVLAMADTGVAMGLGSDLAIESADVVLMSGDLRDLSKAIALARRSMRTVKGLIVLAMIVKMVILILAALGLASMWMAVFADVGVTLLAIVVATRISGYYKSYQ